MRSGATSESSFAEVAISSAIIASGRFHSPATRARATCTPSAGGAKRLNCGSVMLLTDGMIIPIRARGAGIGRSISGVLIVVTTFMVCLRTGRLLNLQSGIAGEWCPESIFLGEECLDAGNIEVLREQGKLSEVVLDLRRPHDAPRGFAELVDDVGRKALGPAQPEPGAAHVGIALLGERRDTLEYRIALRGGDRERHQPPSLDLLADG